MWIMRKDRRLHFVSRARGLLFFDRASRQRCGYHSLFARAHAVHFAVLEIAVGAQKTRFFSASLLQITSGAVFGYS